MKKYFSKPENIAKRKEHDSRPEVKAKKKEYWSIPENKAKKKEHDSRPENKAKAKEYAKEYRSIPENKEKIKKYLENNKERIKTKSRIYQRNHLKEDAKRSSEYRTRHPEQVKKSLHLNYLQHKEQRNKHSKEERLSLKLETFGKYSNENTPLCKNCGESNLVFLTLDHVYGRKKEGHSTNFSGDKLWRYLRRKKFPSGYQVLCWNCNVLKYRNESITYSNNYKAVWAKNKHIKIKNQVLSHYSNGNIACKCCGFDNILVLGLDHIKGKKAHGHSKKMTSIKLYIHLIKEKFPPGYQVFCYNCNGGKGQNPTCPHQLDKMKN